MGLDGLCESELLLRIIAMFKLLIRILQILVPIVAVILITISFYHVIVSAEKGMEKVKIRLRNCLIGMLAIFLIPGAINGIMSTLTGDNKAAACYFEADTEILSNDPFIDDEIAFNDDYVLDGKIDFDSEKEGSNGENTGDDTGDNTGDNSEDETAEPINSDVSGDVSKLIEVAKTEWIKIVHGNFHYSKSHSDKIPLSGHSVDCSSYVSDVLYHFGYTDFAGKQHRTKDFMKNDWNKKYGWTEIPVEGGKDVTSLLKPGDIFVRTNVSRSGSVGYGHVTFIVAIKDGKVYAYDCGSESHWKKEAPITLTKFLKDKRPGKIIRVTK